MLKPLGIEKGQPFNPDARQKKILTEAAEVGFLMAQTLSAAPRLSNASSYPGTKWEWVLTLNPDQEADNYSQLDERTDYTFEAFSVAAGMIKPIVGAGSQYMSTAKDKSGAWLDGGKNYRLRVPANVPVKEFWSVTVYDNMMRSMIQTDTNKAGLDSHQKLQVECRRVGRSVLRSDGSSRAREQLGEDDRRQGLVYLLPLVRANERVLREDVDAAGHREDLNHHERILWLQNGPNSSTPRHSTTARPIDAPSSWPSGECRL